jgi:hypothetical protein
MILYVVVVVGSNGNNQCTCMQSKDVLKNENINIQCCIDNTLDYVLFHMIYVVTNEQLMDH